MGIGEKIKKARRERGVSQKELADRLDVYQKDISRWENGERTPSAEVFAEICRSLKVSADEILELKINVEGNAMTKHENELLLDLLRKKNEELSRALETGMLDEIDLNMTADHAGECLKLKAKLYKLDDTYDVLRGLK